ncbi:Tspear [Symbiodinium natans]|uniref:Tspear protein n=1 Tax=Symbiodinium natans TaxID=878477 RepID=A0A812U0S6_9DINO|nr:Tspear [Symbiodinium natans]
MEPPSWDMGVDLLSATEAEDFAVTHGIDLTASRIEALNAITRVVSAMPFHNLHLLAATPADRKPPNGQEVKAAMLKGQGGLCFVKQPFAAHLLKALGYVVEVVPGSVTHPGNHIVIVVHDVQEKGDRYLVEVGCGYPSRSAVRISGSDHEGFESVFNDSLSLNSAM